MAPVPTEELNKDLRDLREEVTRGRIEAGQLRTQVGSVIAGIRLLGVFVLGGLISSVWWGATLTAKVDAQSERHRLIEARLDKLESSIDARLARIEASVAGVGARP